MNNNILLKYLRGKDWLFGRLKPEASRYGSSENYMFTNMIVAIESRSLITDKKFMKEIMKQVGEDIYLKFLNGEIDTLKGADWNLKKNDINQAAEAIKNITPKTQEDIDKLPTIYPMNLAITDEKSEDMMIYFDQEKRNIVLIRRDFYDLTGGAELKYQYGHYGQPLLYSGNQPDLFWIMPIRIVETEQDKEDLIILKNIVEEMIDFREENREWLEVET